MTPSLCERERYRNHMREREREREREEQDRQQGTSGTSTVLLVPHSVSRSGMTIRRWVFEICRSEILFQQQRHRLDIDNCSQKRRS